MTSAFIAYLLLLFHHFGAITALHSDTSSKVIFSDIRSETIQNDRGVVYSNAVHYSENCLQVLEQEYSAQGYNDLFSKSDNPKIVDDSTTLLYLDQRQFIFPGLSSRVIIYPFHSFP